MTDLKLTARILGDTKEDILRCLRHITAAIEAGETEGDSDDNTSDISWDLEEQRQEPEEEEPVYSNHHTNAWGQTVYQPYHDPLGGRVFGRDKADSIYRH
jgi:hypothetical protein